MHVHNEISLNSDQIDKSLSLLVSKAGQGAEPQGSQRLALRKLILRGSLGWEKFTGDQPLIKGREGAGRAEE